MENKLTKENFCVAGVLYNSVQEQSVELDCILPDYCPEIFKVLSLEIKPCITKQSVDGSKLSYEMIGAISLMYSSEDGEIFTLKQNLDYTKTAELPYPPKNPAISLVPKLDTQSCRVINKRRVDIRGILSVAVKVTQDESISVVSGGSGDGLQFKKEQFTYPVKRIFKSKRVTILEELPLPSEVTSVGCVLKTSAAVTSCDKKVLSGKLLTKGEVQVTCLYTAEGDSVPKQVVASLPFSQILDIEGLDERYEVCVNACVTCCDVTYEGGKLNAGIDIEVNCLAIRYDVSELATDAFSTKYNAEPVYTDVEIEGVPSCFSENHKHRSTISYSEGEISEVYFAGATVKSVGFTQGSDGVIINGKLTAYVFGKSGSGKTVYFEGSSQFEQKLSAKGDILWVCGGVVSVQYNLVSSNAIEVTSDIRLSGCVTSKKQTKLISDIRVDYSKDECEDQGFAIKLYFCKEGETAWDIAKRCKTSPKGIIEENGLDSGNITCPEMLLIPYTN